MAQADILKVLKKDGEWMNTKDIANKLNVESGSVMRALKAMYKYREIFKRSVKKNNYWMYEWKTKQ